MPSSGLFFCNVVDEVVHNFCTWDRNEFEENMDRIQDITRAWVWGVRSNITIEIFEIRDGTPMKSHY
jgi:hypothetical protein